jgi:hypothetical protein
MVMKKKSLLVEVKNEDYAYARKQDRYGCAIVRAIQRTLPQALHVRADVKEIAFSLPEDDTRYYFQTPPDSIKNVIEPLDRGETPEEYTFILDHATAAEPIKHKSRDERITDRTRSRRARPPRARTSSGNVHTANRFMDYEAGEGVEE